MAESGPSPRVVFAFGVVLGLLLSVLGVLAYRGGEMPEDHTEASEPPPANPLAPNPRGPRDPHGPGTERMQKSFATVHFMKKFLKALSEPPANRWPNAGYEPLIKDASNPLSCVDCHDPDNFNVEGMLKRDPGHHAVERFRKNPNFMVPLMRKWVARLNERHAKRLTKRVTCTSCHAIDPQEAWTVLPPLMARFSAALTEKPRNANPAPRWRPLLKDRAPGVKVCSFCHGEVGKKMDADAAEYLEKPHADRYVDDEAFMIALMERWVKRLNETAGGKLVKKVTCVDCHAEDLR